MSLSNLSVSLSSILGGRFYEAWKLSFGPDKAFSLLVVVGAGFTAVCWILVLFFPKTRDGQPPDERG